MAAGTVIIFTGALMRRFILDYVFWTNFFQGSVYFRLVKTMYFGLSPGHVVFYTSLKECTLG